MIIVIDVTTESFLVWMDCTELQLLFVFTLCILKIWASVGTATVSVMGIAFFGESVSMAKIICLAMILFGVVGLELADGH